MSLRGHVPPSQSIGVEGTRMRRVLRVCSGYVARRHTEDGVTATSRSCRMQKKGKETGAVVMRVVMSLISSVNGAGMTYAPPGVAVKRGW